MLFVNESTRLCLPEPHGPVGDTQARADSKKRSQAEGTTAVVLWPEDGPSAMFRILGAKRA